jgi:hypothetical protein
MQPFSALRKVFYVWQRTEDARFSRFSLSPKRLLTAMG